MCIPQESVRGSPLYLISLSSLQHIKLKSKYTVDVDVISLLCSNENVKVLEKCIASDMKKNDLF